ncbi:hypothetical protein IQ268_29675 [Oculatella sp. LEGE 06141]|uniref:hypothetical protein n=1 Tax=Oculatella sp. LEGE 06141 TaxID=1828648 RepID=UPI00187E71EA|nr:hypothetical protein [Oculatella sp. LEGE 06141]MBE9182710.1 hypothetical protein [Oculatella sp. LEGE 06141]
MSFSNRLISSALLAGVVFSVSTLPLAVLGSKPVTIQFEREPVFAGTLRELGSPYLGLATVISLGAGILNFSVMGWRHSSRKLKLAEEEVNSMKQQLRDQETAIERLKFSDSKLGALGLEFFLQDETERSSIAARELAATPHQRIKAQAKTALSSAQPFAGYIRPQMVIEPATTPVAPAPTQDVQSSPQLNELLGHLKQVMSQIEQLNGSQSASHGHEAHHPGTA